MQLTTAAVPCEDEFVLKCDNYISQKSPTDDIRTGSSGCHLIKLCERYPAIDFLVVDNRAGKSSHRLFLIQVSSMKYQDRSADKKVDAVLKPSDITGGNSPAHFYCEKTGVQKKMCFFVYASPEVPKDDSFSSIPDQANIIYFMKLWVQ